MRPSKQLSSNKMAFGKIRSMPPMLFDGRWRGEEYVDATMPPINPHESRDLGRILTLRKWDLSCCSNYTDFLSRHRALVTRLSSQGYKVDRLSNTIRKLYGRHTDLVRQYKKNVCLIVPVKMIDFPLRFVKAELINTAKMMGVMHVEIMFALSGALGD